MSEFGFSGHRMSRYSELEVNQQNRYVGYCISVSCLQSSIFIARNQIVWERNVKYVKHAFGLSAECAAINKTSQM